MSSKLDGGPLVYLNDSIVRGAPKSTQCPLSDSQSWQVMAGQRGEVAAVSEVISWQGNLSLSWVRINCFDQKILQTRARNISRFCLISSNPEGKIAKIINTFNCIAVAFSIAVAIVTD